MSGHETHHGARADGLMVESFPRYADGTWEYGPDLISPERRFSIRWPGSAPKTLLCFPHEIQDLAMGHARLELCGPDQDPDLVSVQDREIFLEPVPRPEKVEVDRDGLVLTAENLLAAMDLFIRTPGRWDDTGCFHRMALLDPKSGSLVRRFEDIARHNCVDRAMGWCLRSQMDPGSLVLLATARATGSLMGKIVKAGFSGIVSRSAVTSAAIDIARMHGVTLAGFARGTRFNLYAEGGLAIPREYEAAGAG